MPPPRSSREGRTSIHHYNHNHTQNNNNSRYAAAQDRNRSASSWQEWEEGGTSFDDGGYQSSGALSSEGATNHGHNRNRSNHNHSALHASLSSSFDHGNYNPMSSVRSVGSTSSHGSGHGRAFGSGFGFGHTVAAAAHLFNGETRFPTTMSYASDAQQSDVATVCSGSVMEEYEVESVISADLNNPAPTVTNSATQSSPPSSVKMTVGPSIAASANAFSVTNPPPNDCESDIQNDSRGLINNQLQASTSNSSAGQPLEAVVPHKGMPMHAVGLEVINGLCHGNHRHVAASLQQQPDPHLALHSNMGPPLSRKLLLQQHPQHQRRHHTSGNSSQEAGSVKSYESNAGSDVVAHVDTDDCGGSLDMDVHSIHSQEDIGQPEGTDNDNAAKAVAPSKEGTEEGTNDDTTSKVPAVNPLLCSSETSTNGRTSPGGTIYKGRGNRRYQGRYMHLPLKRFHQNCVDLGEAVHTQPQTSDASNGWKNGNNRDRSISPERRHRQRQHPRDRKSPRRRHMNGKRKSSHSRSRSRTRSRSRDRDHSSHSPSPMDNNSFDDYDNRKPRARGGRWHQQNGTSSGDNRGGRGGSRGNHNYHRNGYKNNSNGSTNNGNGHGGNHRGPARTRSKRRSPRR